MVGFAGRPPLTRESAGLLTYIAVAILATGGAAILQVAGSDVPKL